MKSSKSHTTQEDDDEYDDDFASKKEGSSNLKDAKNNDKVSAIRSKHSVTEQRRRSKINERFQMLRDLIPHGDQKRDTASFLLEVIEYVQLLQEKVQKYEGPYQQLGTESTKLIPWRHSQWRVQSYLGHPQSIKNGPGSGSASTFAGKMDERNFSHLQTPVEIDSGHENYRNLDQHPDVGEKAAFMPTSFHMHAPNIVRSDGDESRLSQRDALSIPCAIQSDDQPGEHVIEGGTISITSAYSHGLLMTLTQALQSSGVDLTEANISIRIDLGKRANPSLLPGLSTNSKEREIQVSQDKQIRHDSDGNSRDGLDQPHKKLKS
ncbi:hypothetical protein RND81_07G173500 [Saponaria officinalis]|uniref:BHLH domain-containing protein n=1 Tax=Saponaria officinalis TaxID=3572 RepID=A0AAW1JTF5_SAPOF